MGVFTAGRRGQLRLERLAIESLTGGTSRDDDWVRRTGAAAGLLCDRLGWSGAVTVVLPGHLVLTKFVKTPRLEPTKREKVILFEAQQSMPCALSEVVWGHAVAGETVEGVEEMLCAVKRETVEALCAAVEQAGVSLRAVVPGPVALVAAYRRARSADALPTVLLEIGARTTTLALVEARQFHLRTLPLGGEAFPPRTTENPEGSWADAEEREREPGSRDAGAPALETLAGRLAVEVTRSVLHFKRQSGAAEPGRIVLAGGGARLDGLADLLGARLRMPVEQFDALSGIEIAPAAAGAAGQAVHLAAACGAAALQFSSRSLAIDLRPARLKSAEDTRRRRPWLMAAVGLAASALLLPLLHWRNVERELRAKIAAIDAVIAPLREREDSHRRDLARLAELTRRAGELQAVHDRSVSWQQFLADLQDRLGQVEDVWLERLQLAPAPATDRAVPGALRLAVSGRILDRTSPLAKVSPDAYRRATDLLGSLAQSPFLSAVESERFDDEQPGILRFDFVLVTRPARPL